MIHKTSYLMYNQFLTSYGVCDLYILTLKLEIYTCNTYAKVSQTSFLHLYDLITTHITT